MTEAEGFDEPTVVRRQRVAKIRPGRRALKWTGLSLAYLSALFLFAYCSFPYERLKHKLTTQLNSRATPDGLRVEIDDLTWSWRFPGLVAEGIRFVEPPRVNLESEHPALDEEMPKPPAPVEISELYARIAPLSLLFGTKDISFSSGALGGKLSGQAKVSDAQTSIEMELDALDVSRVPGVSQIVGLPLEGTLAGTVMLVLAEGKVGKATGEIDLVIDNVAFGDGKAKILNTLALPRLEVGKLVIKASIVEGRLKVTEFGAQGPDIEVSLLGKLRLRDEPLKSVSDLTLSLHFTDRYKTKNDLTRALFGEPDSSTPGLFDLNPQVKRARDAEGYYTWRVSGSLDALRFVPAVGMRVRAGSDDEEGAPAMGAPRTLKSPAPRPTLPVQRSLPSPSPVLPVAPAPVVAVTPPPPPAPPPPPPPPPANTGPPAGVGTLSSAVIARQAGRADADDNATEEEQAESEEGDDVEEDDEDKEQPEEAEGEGTEQQ